MIELRKKTRTSLWNSTQLDLKYGSKSNGDHVHEYAETIDNDDGTIVQICITCGIKVTFEEF